jgi:hypothetical protein
MANSNSNSNFTTYANFDINFRKQLYNQIQNLFTTTLSGSTSPDDYKKKITTLNNELVNTTFAKPLTATNTVCQFPAEKTLTSSSDGQACFENYINNTIQNQIKKDLSIYNDRLNTLKTNITNKYNDYELLYYLTNNNNNIFNSLDELYKALEKENDETKNNINKERHNTNIIDNKIDNKNLKKYNNYMNYVIIILFLIIIALGVFLYMKNKDSTV